MGKNFFVPNISLNIVCSTSTYVSGYGVSPAPLKDNISDKQCIDNNANSSPWLITEYFLIGGML